MSCSGSAMMKLRQQVMMHSMRRAEKMPSLRLTVEGRHLMSHAAHKWAFRRSQLRHRTRTTEYCSENEGQLGRTFFRPSHRVVELSRMSVTTFEQACNISRDD